MLHSASSTTRVPRPTYYDPLLPALTNLLSQLHIGDTDRVVKVNVNIRVRFLADCLINQLCIFHREIATASETALSFALTVEEHGDPRKHG